MQPLVCIILSVAQFTTQLRERFTSYIFLSVAQFTKENGIDLTVRFRNIVLYILAHLQEVENKPAMHNLQFSVVLATNWLRCKVLKYCAVPGGTFTGGLNKSQQ